MSFLEEDKNNMTQVSKLFADYSRRNPFYNFGFHLEFIWTFYCLKKEKQLESVQFLFSF